MLLPCRLKERFLHSARRGVLAVLTAVAVAGCGTTSSVVRGEEGEAVPSQNDPLPQMIPDKYEESLFEVNFRKVSGNKSPVSETSPHKRLGLYMDTFCFKPRTPADFSSHYSQNWVHYPEVAGLTLFGKPLADRAHALGVHYCDLEQLPPGIGGQFLPTLRAIILPKSDGDNFGLPLTLGHEVMHGAQHHNGELNYSRNWDMSARISRTLAIEAAAITTEFMIAYEAKEAGNPTLWNFLQKRQDGAYADKRIYTALPAAHKAALAQGQTPEIALKSAAKDVFHLVLENREWRKFYLDFELRNYLSDVTSGVLDRENVHALEYGQDRIDRAGLIGGLPSFTEGGRLPPINDILEAEPKIRWAFEAVNIGRFERRLGKDDDIVVEMRVKAQLNGNPYLGVSLGDLQKNVIGGGFQETAGKNFLYVHQVLDAMLASPPPSSPPPPQPAAKAGPSA